MTNKNDPAMPHLHDSCQRVNDTEHWPGLTAAERAAIALRVPSSGTPWLDEMIRQARVLDIATAIEAAWLNNSISPKMDESQEAIVALVYARALLAESERGK